MLVDRLRERGDRVLGIDRDVSEVVGEGPGEPVTVADVDSVAVAVETFKPDEIYYLAAHHRSSQGTARADALGEDLREGLRVNVDGLVNFLEALRSRAPEARLFYASSSLIFGKGGADERQDEETPWTPMCEYGLMKALGMQACRLYRERCGVYAACGILYNHESAYRPPDFLSQKVVLAARRIRDGCGEKLTLGDLDAVTDWSYAPDVVDAFPRILSLDRPADFVVASGEGHTVREFVEAVFTHVGLDWRDHVEQAPGLLYRVRSARIGNPRRLREATGWRRSLTFEEMVRRLVDDAAEGRDSVSSKCELACAVGERGEVGH